MTRWSESLKAASTRLGVFGFIAALAVAAQPAQALLVTHDVNVTLNALNLDSYNLDVDRNGTTDFTFATAFDPSLPTGFAVVMAPFGSANGVLIDMPSLNGFPNATRLAPGSTVSAANTFSNASFDQANLFSLASGAPEGNFEDQTGLIGLRFDGAGGSFFGFAEVTVNGADAPLNPLGMTIGTVGFNDVSGAGVTIPLFVSEPPTLLLAALAAFGLIGTRRRTTAGGSIPGRA